LTISNYKEDSPAASIISGREVKADMGSDASFQTLGSWIRDCAMEHDQCYRLPASVLEKLPTATHGPIRYSKRWTEEMAIPRLPLHVIDVGPQDGSQEPYLRNTYESAESAYYITLSHCWGDTKPLTTTISTYWERCQCIPMAALPQTFRDAVVITRALGIRFLWIDSLCIVQDSEEDWQIQSDRIGSIYALSFLTINAAASPDSNGGCFAKRSSSGNSQCIIRPKDSPAEIYVTNYADEIPLNQNNCTGTRAWCLQEIVLPQRVVVYGAKMMGWLCNTKNVSEQAGDLSSGVGFRMEEAWGRSENLNLQRWSFLVNNYTQRNLTYDRDKLVAIAGLAAQIGYVLKDTYLAGIWMNELVDGLLWYVGGRGQATRPAKYRAPSWSWASLSGPIFLGVSTSTNESITVKVVDWQINNKKENCYGEVSGGMPKLSGPFAKIKFSEGCYYILQPAPEIGPSKLKDAEDSKCHEDSRDISNTLPVKISRVFDIPGEKHWPSMPLWCLGMTAGRYKHIFPNAQKAYDVPYHSLQRVGKGLILTSTGKKNEYMRVGVAEVFEFSTFSSYSSQVVTLI